ncbi:MAG: hypothetical protein O3B95_11680 [Chloroflexi bacterium]|nr:hypothetical protein [Chloroflexota bacterium]
MTGILKRKLVRYTGMAVVLVVLLVLLGGGWYFSSVLEEDGLRIDNDPPEPKVSVVGVDGGTITLRQLIQAEEEEH